MITDGIELCKQVHRKAKQVGAKTVEGATSSYLGSAYQILCDFQQAVEYHMQDLSIAKELGDRANEGRAYGNLGIAYDSLGDFEQAIEYHTKNLSNAKELGDRAREGRAYSNLGVGYHKLGDFKKAVKYYTQALSIATELEDMTIEEAAYGNLGNAYQGLGDFKQAMEYHTQCLSIAKKLGDRVGEGRAYGNLGNVYRDLSDFKKAIEYHTLHLSIAKELGDRSEEGRAFGNLGNCYDSLGDFEKAIEYHTQHYSITKELGDRVGEGTAYGGLGNAYQGLGDFKQAIEYHTQDLSIAKKLGDMAGEGRAYGSLGNAHQSLGNFKQAIEYMTLDLSFAKELGDGAGEGRAYCNLGAAYQSLGDFKQAIEYRKRSLNIAKELGDRAVEGSAIGNLGNTFHSLGDAQQAIDYHTKHLSIAKELGDRAGEECAYDSLGNAYQSLGDLEQAIEYHMQHLNIAKELKDRNGERVAYSNLGNDYRSLGDFKQAIEYYTQDVIIAKELGNRDGEGAAYGNLGNAYLSLGDLEHAKQYHLQHLSIAKELGDITGEAHANYSLGLDFEFSDALQEALAYYRVSVKLFNGARALLQSKDLWKITFRNTYHHAYTALWRTLVKLENTSEALCVAEQGRAQALSNLMKLQYDPELLVSGSLEVTIPGILSVTSTQIVFVALESNNIYLWVLNKETNAQFRHKEVLDEDAADFLESLRKDVFIEHQISARVDCENRSLDELKQKTPTSREFEQETSKKPACNNNTLRRFHDYIIGPIADLVQGCELIIVPDGPLCLAPFVAFLDGKSRYLSETVRIRILPSLTCLKLIADSAQDYHRTTGALLVGDPCLEEVTNKRGRPILSPLPCAREEVMAIGKLLDIKPLTGKEATKEEVLRRIGSVALVHIAAHGDMKSGEIALSPNPTRKSKIPKESDFKLKMADVQAVELRAKLVVLSCCHSAQGTVTPQGVVGIGRAFLGAGARSVLLSLWAINDEATMEFMKSFYENLSHGYSASVAVNWAMKCLRESEKFGAVKYWAPFVLIGDDVTIEFGANQ